MGDIVYNRRITEMYIRGNTIIIRRVVKMYKLKVLIEYDENFYGEQMYEFANKGSDKSIDHA